MALIKDRATGHFLDIRGKFRKGLSASDRVKTFDDPSVAGLVSTTPTNLLDVCARFDISPTSVWLTREPDVF